jgi:hypothetical protein
MPVKTFFLICYLTFRAYFSVILVHLRSDLGSSTRFSHLLGGGLEMQMRHPKGDITATAKAEDESRKQQEEHARAASIWTGARS